MEEHLVGYLFGALDPSTQQEVEAHLRADPPLRQRLSNLEKRLAPLEADREPPEPPAHLYHATLARIAAHQTAHSNRASLRKEQATRVKAPAPSPGQVGSAGRPWFRRVDWMVAAVILFLVGGLSVTAVVRQWQQYHRVACGNNLRLFWVSLQAYSDHHDGSFPKVDTKGPRKIAGIFVPILKDQQVLHPEVSVECPASGHRPPTSMSVKELEELYQYSPQQFHKVACELAGSYAYTLGYSQSNTHHGLRREDHRLPILADRPLTPEQGNSANHGGSGQNVLYIGGEVRWCTHRTVGLDADDIYLNRQRKVRAGLGRADTVLGSSEATPCPVD